MKSPHHFCLAIKDRARLDDMSLNFGFRRLPIADPVMIDPTGGMIMKTAKFAGPLPKPKPVKKMHITKDNYRNTTAARVEGSLDRFFATKPK